MIVTRLLLLLCLFFLWCPPIFPRDVNDLDHFEVNPTVGSIAFSSSGRFLMAGGTHGVELWETRTWKRVWASARQNEVNYLAFSADDEFAVSGSNDGIVVLWLAKTGEIVKQYSSGGEPISCVKFIGNTLVAVTKMGQILQWNIKTAALLFKSDPVPRSGSFFVFEPPDPVFSGMCLAVSMSQANDLAAVGCNDGSIHILDLRAKKRICTAHSTSPGWINSLSFDWAGLVIASVTRSPVGVNSHSGNEKINGVLNVWDARSCQNIRTISKVGENIQSAFFIMDGSLLIQSDHQLVFFDLEKLGKKNVIGNRWGLAVAVSSADARYTAIKTTGDMRVYILRAGGSHRGE